MDRTRRPLADELTTKAKDEGIAQMQAYLTRRSGRPRSREDARAAFENLLGFYATVCEWQARAVLEDRAQGAAAPEPAPRVYRRKKTSKGRKATTTE